MSGGGQPGTVGILVGGGPAPGINGVIGAATMTARARGARVVGILEGFKWLMEGKAGIEGHTLELTRDAVARIHVEGGSILFNSRANPTRDPAHLAACAQALDSLGVDKLVTIGGDDTATSAIAVSQATGGRIQVVHVPKTIDNDLPLPEGIPTFGYESAREQAAQIVSALQEDARTTRRWFIAVLMGRQAGFLALGTGVAAGATLSVIAEEFPDDPIRLDDVVRVIEGSIVKRRALGRPDGMCVIGEGIALRLDPNDLEALKDVARDEHGHIRLPDVPLARVVADAVKASLAARDIPVAFVTKDVGYELRCVPPCAFDREYTRDLGAGAIDLLMAGQSGVLVSRQQGRCVPIRFEDVLDPATKRARVRYVDLDSHTYRYARALQVRIEAADLDDSTSLAAIAEAAHLTPDEARARYAPLR